MEQGAGHVVETTQANLEAETPKKKSRKSRKRGVAAGEKKMMGFPQHEKEGGRRKGEFS